MLIHFLRSNSPAAYIFLPLLAVLLWVAAFFHPVVHADSHEMPLYAFLTSFFLNYQWLGILTALILVIAEAFLINHLVNEYEVLSRHTFLPAFFYILLLSSNYLMMSWHPALPANLFILFAIVRLSASYRKDTAYSHAFDAAFLVSIASLFYFPYIIFFSLVAVGLILMRPFIWREWVIAFFGALLPYLFALALAFWNDNLHSLLHDKILYSLQVVSIRPRLEAEFYFLLSFGCLILLLSLAKIFGSTTSAPQITRKGISIMIWCFIFSGLGIFYAPIVSAPYFSAFAIPVSVFYSIYFLGAKRYWLVEILALFFTGTIITNLIIHFV